MKRQLVFVCWVAMLDSLVGVSSVLAQGINYSQREARAGDSLQLGYHATANHNCTGASRPSFRLIEAPKSGTLTSRHAVLTTNKLPGCPDLKTPALVVFYQPRADYVGRDHMVYVVTSSNGEVATYDVTIEVKAVEVKAGPQFVGPKWRPLSIPLPLAQSERKADATFVFKKVKDTVWAVVALRRSAAGEMQLAARGSAVAVSPLLLATNCHVAQGADRLVITQGSKRIDVVLLAAHSSTDRCILVSQEALPAHVPGVKRFSDMQIGERVYTVGSPRGLENTLGDGLLSGLRSTKSGRLVQTSAPISPGSSGGGLFDEAGNLVGITTLTMKESQALNFAIAAEDFWQP